MLTPEYYLDDRLFDEFISIPFSLVKTHPLARIGSVGYQGADMVGTHLAEYTLKEGVVGGINLFTPEIRRFEETALVGLGGRII